VIQPVSMVMGLVTMDPTSAVEQVAFLGEAMMEWCYPGKVTGMAVESTKKGNSLVLARLIELMGENIPDVEKTLEGLKLHFPKEEGASLSQLILANTVDSKESLASMRELAAQIGVQGWEAPAPDLEPQDIEPSAPAEATSPGEMNISGLYQGTTTVTAAKNDSMGEVKPLEFRIVQNDNGTATLLRDGLSVDGTYNPATGEFSLDYGFTWNLVFSREGDTIVARGTMTSNETGEGYTQEITLDMKKTGD